MPNPILAWAQVPQRVIIFVKVNNFDNKMARGNYPWPHISQNRVRHVVYTKCPVNELQK